MRRLLAILLLFAASLPAYAFHRPTRYRVRATAFCEHGITAAGTRSRSGTLAADPALFPIGTLLRVRNAGPYSGTYQVTDTGRKVRGLHIDLRLPSLAIARRFGRRVVWVQVLKWGTGDVRGPASN